MKVLNMNYLEHYKKNFDATVIVNYKNNTMDFQLKKRVMKDGNI